ncbi:MAG: flagellar assembly protein FliW [Thiovulaceae bacterium]|nr:flagellar assembly protein FliW [Sulfurimonadaceae bacterium]
MEYEVKVPLLGFENIFSVTLSKIDDIFAKITTSDEGPTFTLINPYALREYSFDIPQATQVILDLNQDSEILLYNMVIIHNPIEESTVNFIAPIIFNASNNTMAQIILDSTKHKDFGIAEPIKNFMHKEEATQ